MSSPRRYPVRTATITYPSNLGRIAADPDRARKDRQGRRFLGQAEVDAARGCTGSYELAFSCRASASIESSRSRKGKASAPGRRGSTRARRCWPARHGSKRPITAVGPELAGITYRRLCWFSSKAGASRALEPRLARRGRPRLCEDGACALRPALQTPTASRSKLLHLGPARTTGRGGPGGSVRYEPSGERFGERPVGFPCRMRTDHPAESLGALRGQSVRRGPDRASKARQRPRNLACAAGPNRRRS